MSSHSKKILKKLAEKPAIIADPLAFGTTPSQGEEKYAITRALKNLAQSGHVEFLNSDNKKYVKITPRGKTKLNSLLLENTEALVPQTWDGLWRIIILDLPEERKSERESLRYLLKKANFVCVKNTVWISPFPYEHLFSNIKKDLGLSTELMIIVADKLDDQTQKAFLASIHS